MPLVTTKEMFEKAYKGGYAVGAFNVNNMEIVQGITEAAGELKAPLILQVSKGARNYANHTYLMKLVEAAVIETGLPMMKVEAPAMKRMLSIPASRASLCPSVLIWMSGCEVYAYNVSAGAEKRTPSLNICPRRSALLIS